MVAYPLSVSEGVEGLALEVYPCLSIGVDVAPALDTS